MIVYIVYTNMRAYIVNGHKWKETNYATNKCEYDYMIYFRCGDIIENTMCYIILCVYIYVCIYIYTYKVLHVFIVCRYVV